MKVCAVDGRVGGYLDMVGDISVRELAADDIGMFGKGGEGRGDDVDIV